MYLIGVILTYLNRVVQIRVGLELAEHEPCEEPPVRKLIAEN